MTLLPDPYHDDNTTIIRVSSVPPISTTTNTTVPAASTTINGTPIIAQGTKVNTNTILTSAGEITIPLGSTINNPSGFETLGISGSQNIKYAGLRELLGGVPDISTTGTPGTSSASASIFLSPISGEPLTDRIVEIVKWNDTQIWAHSNVRYSFQVFAELAEGGNRITGIFNIDDIELIIDNDSFTIFPTDVKASSGALIQVYPEELLQLSSGQMQMSYILRMAMTYENTDNESKIFDFLGIGVLTFRSTEDIYNSIINGTTLAAESHTFTVHRCSGGQTPYSLRPRFGVVRFTMTEANGVMVGVSTVEQEWASTTKNCGPSVDQFFDVDAEFKPFGSPRWGTPILFSEDQRNDISFDLRYKYDVRDVLNDGNLGKTLFETTSIAISADSLTNLINKRLLMRGSTLRQVHSYTAMNDYQIQYDTYADCENTSGGMDFSIYGYTGYASGGNQSWDSTLTYTTSSGTQDITGDINKITISSNDLAYVEWATSFVQEYRGDKRFTSVDKYIQSNGIGATPTNYSVSYIPLAWKRHMDGVGLGGDVPDYDTIFDKKLKKIKAASNWKDMNYWHVGQMCFGTPDAAVIIGGHKVDRSICETGRNSGYHGMPTTKRVFIWDMTEIPEEDSYLKNYMGRRMFTYNTETPSTSSNGNCSSLNVMIFEGESDIIIERYGSSSFDGSSNKVTVTFDKPLPSEVGESYSVSLSPNDNVKVWWENKTPKGFDILISLKKWTGVVDYAVTSIIKATETDVNTLDTLDSFEFDK